MLCLLDQHSRWRDEVMHRFVIERVIRYASLDLNRVLCPPVGVLLDPGFSPRVKSP